MNEYNRICGQGLNIKYITTIEMSEIWVVSSRRSALLCEQGRITYYRCS